MNDLTIQIEKIDQFYPDANDLFIKDWEETTNDGIEFKVDEAEYRKLEQEGRLLIVTARDGKILAGYIGFSACGSFHHDLTVATCNGLYVDKSYRGKVGSVLIKTAINILKEAGVAKMRISTSTKNNVGKLYERFGLLPEEIIYGMTLNLNQENKSI